MATHKEKAMASVAREKHRADEKTLADMRELGATDAELEQARRKRGMASSSSSAAAPPPAKRKRGGRRTADELYNDLMTQARANGDIAKTLREHIEGNLESYSRRITGLPDLANMHNLARNVFKNGELAEATKDVVVLSRIVHQQFAKIAKSIEEVSSRLAYLESHGGYGSHNNAPSSSAAPGKACDAGPSIKEPFSLHVHDPSVMRQISSYIKDGACLEFSRTAPPPHNGPEGAYTQTHGRIQNAEVYTHDPTIAHNHIERMRSQFLEVRRKVGQEGRVGVALTWQQIANRDANIPLLMQRLRRASMARTLAMTAATGHVTTTYPTATMEHTRKNVPEVYVDGRTADGAMSYVDTRILGALRGDSSAFAKEKAPPVKGKGKAQKEPADEEGVDVEDLLRTAKTETDQIDMLIQGAGDMAEAALAQRSKGVFGATGGKGKRGKKGGGGKVNSACPELMVKSGYFSSQQPLVSGAGKSRKAMVVKSKLDSREAGPFQEATTGLVKHIASGKVVRKQT